MTLAVSAPPPAPLRSGAGVFSAALEKQQADDAAAAEPLYRQVLEHDPGFADAWNNLGVLLQRAGRGEEAVDCFDRLVALEPGVARGHANRGVALKTLGRSDEAITAYQRSLAIEPDNDGAHGNLGNLLFDRRRYAEALTHYASAVRLQPAHAGYRLMLGKTLLELGHPAAAEAEFHATLAREATPTVKADAWGLLARIWSERHCPAEAIDCFDHGLALQPDYPAVIYNRGLARLLAGDLTGGFADYEHRFDVLGFPGRRMAETHPLWRGEVLPGKTLFLHSEQGAGDSVQFLRYLPQVATRIGPEGRIVFAVQSGLETLIPKHPQITVVTTGAVMPKVEAVCPLLSLPHVLGIDRLSVPAPVPYLEVGTERTLAWQQRMSTHVTRLRIALVWAGNPAHSNDANRSMPLAALQPLLNAANCTFFSLQFGARAADIAALGLGQQIIDLAPHLKDFADTAAALTQMDLLVCVDTSVAHLAGALGVPTWLLLPYMPDWRWRLARDDSPWYPSLRLFRQIRPGDWAGVVSAAHTALDDLIPGSERRPASADFLFEQTRTALERSEADTATTLAWAGLRQHPFHAHAWNLLAVGAWRDQQHYPAALFGARAARFNAGDPANWSNLGAFLKALGRLDEAVIHQQRAVQIDPNNAGAQSNLGNTLGALGRWEEAIAAARRAVSLAPTMAEYQYNLGVVLREIEDFPGALAAFRQALAIDPQHVRAQLHESLLELMLGDLDAGWGHYECRWLQPDCKEVRHFNRPQWLGEDIAGKRILIHAEQGFGDTFQFLRYIPLVAARGAEVVLVVQPSLESFAARIPGVTFLVKGGESLPACDLHCPLLSLPRALNTRLASIPAAVPYLQALPEKQAHWHARLADLKNYRVGIVWAGRPTHGNDANRSIVLEQFTALLSDPRFDFVSVQKGEPVSQIATLSSKTRLLNLDPEIVDFEDTAAILGELDELLTVDTSVAHLAGALGVKTRVLLPRLPDWRWLWDRADSPWYPTLTLYRQDKRKDWSAPLVRLAKDLRAAAKKKKGK
ncbi:MAG: tetratricopeptide repeat protein [Rhodocyclaceae bacterium]|nr:tetratricopeptide repeat protein [Rhodocyclaceae bacterium]MDZ4215276.1 tetratricopeptide repeat protein [Rhodocyclaceae bacterium]